MPTSHDIQLREADGPNPPGRLRELKERLKKKLEDVLDAACGGAGKWIDGKGGQEQAKADHEYAMAEHERAKAQSLKDMLLKEFRAVELEIERTILTHNERMYELETQRIQARADALDRVVDCVIKLAAQGFIIEFEIVQQMILGK